MRKLVNALLALIAVLFLLPANGFADDRSERNNREHEAVKKPLYSKEGKHELVPNFAMSTNDAFYQNYYFGVTYNYHPANWISFGGFLHGAFPQETGLTKTLQRPPQQGGFNVKPDVRRPFFLSDVGAEVRFALVYGKLNFFSQAILHFDLFLLLRGGVFITHPPNVTGKGEMGINPFGGIGFGQRYFLLKWLAARWQFAADFMPETFENRGNQSRLRINMAINFGFSFFF